MSGKRFEISETELRDAILHFKARGGLIKKLPEQPNPVRNLVGAKWAIYETVSDDFQTVSVGE